MNCIILTTVWRTLYTSAVTEDGKQYAYSLLFNLIAEVDPATMAFLDWDIVKFVDRPIFQKTSTMLLL